MFKLTQKLKDHAVSKLGVPQGSKDAVFFKMIGAALVSKKITAKQIAEINGEKTEPEPNKGNGGGGQQGNVLDLLLKSFMGDGNGNVDPDNAKSVEQFQNLIKSTVKDALGQSANTDITPENVLLKATGNTRVKVLSAAETYSKTTKQALYPERSGLKGEGTPHLLAGRPAQFGKFNLDHPSELAKAIGGAYFKWCVKSQAALTGTSVPTALQMNQHEKDLLLYALNEERWSGLVKGTCTDSGALKVPRRKLSEFEIKAVLDDTVSGGIEISPVVFDDAIILTPVLYGELFPYVNMQNVSKGRRIKGGSMLNPTFTSGIAEGTAVQPFNTSGFVQAFDTTIFSAVGAIELGADFEEDSAVDLGGQIIDAYGFKALEWGDRVIAIGDGVTEPTGIFNTTGPRIVLSANGAGGPLAVSDTEGLMFGVDKQFRNEAGAMCVYLGNDTMYRRIRAIPIGPGDERRIYGMDHGSYMVSEKPYKVQNNVANGRLAFVNLKRYRMYRRLGLAVRIETAGRQLALSNTKLIVLRMRFGGQLELGGAAALMNDAWF